MATTQSPTWSCPESPSCGNGQVVALDLQHGQVGLRVGANNLPGEAALIWK